MKLLFKERFFSWFDSYDIYNENGETVFTVQGKMSWGHKLHILNKSGDHIATVKEDMPTLFLPSFELYKGSLKVGYIQKKLSFFRPHFVINFHGWSWSIKGNLLEWDYNIIDEAGREVAVISKEIFNFTDTYSIEVANERDALYALMVTLAIDAEKCSRSYR